MPFAAFFVAFLLLLCIPRRSRKLAVCLLLGALAGLCAVYTTNARLERTRANYAGRTVLLTAEVERADSTYFSDTVDATLWVESVNGSPAGFRITCAELPACAAGQRVQGRFTLQQPDMEERTAQYADGIALRAEPLAEKPQLTVLGESGSFRARTHRLQQKLSESLRREMHRDTGGVLAAMTVGDRSGLSAQLRSAYRGAGLSHVLHACFHPVRGYPERFAALSLGAELPPPQTACSGQKPAGAGADGRDRLYALGAPRRRGGVGQRLGRVGVGATGRPYLAGGGRHPDDRRQQLCGVGYRL